MTQPDSERHRNTGDRRDGATVSRRNVLKTGTLASGTLILGSTTVRGNVVARRQGGAGFIPVEDFEGAIDDDRTFKVLDPKDLDPKDDVWTLEHAAGCDGKGNGEGKGKGKGKEKGKGKKPTREYTGYPIRFAEGGEDQFVEGEDDHPGPPLTGHLYVESNRYVEPGVWQDVTAYRDCPPAGTATDPSGGRHEQEVLRVAFRPTDFGGRAGLAAGRHVVDSEDPDPDPAVVIAVFDVPISDWIVYGNETVAYQNPSYDPEERTVVVVFEHLLEAGWPDWAGADPDSLFDGVVDRGIKFYAYPQSRLE